MSLLSSKHFTESDFFFLVESFTIFFEKMLPLYHYDSQKTVKDIWLQFKHKLMDKTNTTSQVFAFSNNIKIPAEVLSTVNKHHAQELQNQNNKNINNAIKNTDRKYSNPQYEKKGIGSFKGKQTSLNQIKEELQSNTINSSNQTTSNTPNTVINLMDHHSHQNSNQSSGQNSKLQDAELHKIQLPQAQKRYSEPLHLQQKTLDAVKQDYYTGKINQQENKDEESPTHDHQHMQVERVKMQARGNHRRNSRRIQLKKQKSRTLSMEKYEKIDIIEGDTIEEEQLEQAGQDGYQQRLDKLRTKSPVDEKKSPVDYRYKIKRKSENQDFDDGIGQEESVMERIKPYDLIQYKNSNNNNIEKIDNQSNPSQTYKEQIAQLSGNKNNYGDTFSTPQTIRREQQEQQTKAFTIQKNQTSKQDQELPQRGTFQEQNKTNTTKQYTHQQQQPQYQLKSLSNLKKKQPSFTSKTKDELFNMVQQGINLIKKHGITIDLIADKSVEIDTTKNANHTLQREQYQQPGTSKFGQYAKPQNQQNLPEFQQITQQKPQQVHNQKSEQKKSYTMKKVSVFIKQDQQPKQQQQLPQQPVVQPYNYQNHMVNNYLTQNNNVYQKMQNVYDNPNKYIPQKKDYNNGYKYGMGKVIL